MKKKLVSYILIMTMAITTLAIPSFAFAETSADGAGDTVSQEDSLTSSDANSSTNSEEASASQVTTDTDSVTSQGSDAAKTSSEAKNYKPTVKATCYDYKTIKLTWKKVSGATKYKVYISSDKKTWKKLATVSDTTYYSKDIATARTRYYKVESVLSGASVITTSSLSDSIFTSDVVSAKTYLKTTTSVKSTLKTVKKQVLKWNKVAGANGYAIYKWNPKTKKYQYHKSVKGGSTLSANVTLTPGKTNYFKVKAYRYSEGEKIYSSYSNYSKRKVPKVLKRSTSGFSTTNANKIIKVAKSKVGCSYVYGASGPNRFDCSGFVYYVTKKANAGTKKLKRSTAQSEYRQLKKYNIGKNIKNAQPGDIIFYSSSGSTSNIHHVGIYYGNGKIIHASTSSTGVIISSYKYSGKVAAICRLPGV